jgi:hypothetical protein
MELILSYASFFLLLSCPPFDSAELALTLSYASFLFVARLFPLRGFLSPCIGYVELGFFFFSIGRKSLGQKKKNSYL